MFCYISLKYFAAHGLEFERKAFKGSVKEATARPPDTGCIICKK